MGGKTMMERWGTSKEHMWMAVVASLALLLASGAGAARAEECVSPSPREVPVKTINIYNNSTIPIYAVLETAKQIQPDPENQNRPHDRWLQAEFKPTPGTYTSTYIYRSYVNPKNGILPRSSVSVTIPFYTQLETSPCPFQPDQYINWWRALRIAIYDDPGGIKHAYEGDQKTAVVITPPGVIPTCPIHGPAGQKCASPLVVYQDHSGGDGHGLSLPPTDPSQLLEFTFASVDPPPLPLKIDHDFVDYDISSVDQVYLPVAMDPVGNPYIGWVGSVRELGTGKGKDGFRDRLAQFQKAFEWPKYNWPPYVTNQGNLRLPGTYNVMNEIANPVRPPAHPPFIPSGQDIKQLPVIQAMEKM